MIERHAVWSGLERRIRDTPATTLAGPAVKARAVRNNLQGGGAFSEEDDEAALDLARAVLAIAGEGM